MRNLRKYGKTPYVIAVIHGGPGAPGEMAPIAKELSKKFGVLEPLQTKKSIIGQVEELKSILKKHGRPPLTLIGFSWGALLSFIFTAKYPENVKKLIFVGSGVFKEKYAENIMKTRYSRLLKKERIKLKALLNDLKKQKSNKIFSQIGKLITKADSYKKITHKNEIIEYQYNIFNAIWPELKSLRKSGHLLKLGKKINCPLVTIHGDYDPHPAKSIKASLSSVVKDFKFYLLIKCGHYPWLEKEAKDKFYKILKKEI